MGKAVIVRVIYFLEKLSKKVALDSEMTGKKALEFIKENKYFPLYTLEGIQLYLAPLLKKPGEWISDEVPLQYYGVESGSTIEIKVKSKSLNIRPAPGYDPVSVDIDPTMPIGNMTPYLLNKLNLTDDIDYYLAVDGQDEYLDFGKTMKELGLPPETTMVLKQKTAEEQKRGGLLSGWKNKFGKKETKEEKKTKTQVFGMPLEEVCNRDNVSIPTVCEKAFQYIEAKALDAEGIFRLSGTTSAILEWKRAFDAGEDVDLNSEGDPHVITGLLKMYFREMPEPLITYGFYDLFVSVQKQTTGTKQLTKYYIALLNALPPRNKELLIRLISFLSKIVEKSEINKMTVNNLSVVFAPNLIKASPDEGAAPSSGNALLEDTNIQKGIFSVILENSAHVIQFQNIRPYYGYAKALSDHNPEAPHELRFKTGDIVFIRDIKDQGWWLGEFDDQRGVFPNYYVQLLGSFTVKQAKPAPAPPPPTPDPKRKDSKKPPAPKLSASESKPDPSPEPPAQAPAAFKDRVAALREKKDVRKSVGGAVGGPGSSGPGNYRRPLTTGLMDDDLKEEAGPRTQLLFDELNEWKAKYEQEKERADKKQQELDDMLQRSSRVVGLEKEVKTLRERISQLVDERDTLKKQNTDLEAEVTSMKKKERARRKEDESPKPNPTAPSPKALSSTSAGSVGPTSISSSGGANSSNNVASLKGKSMDLESANLASESDKKSSSGLTRPASKTASKVSKSATVKIKKKADASDD